MEAAGSGERPRPQASQGRVVAAVVVVVAAAAAAAVAAIDAIRRRGRFRSRRHRNDD